MNGGSDHSLLQCRGCQTVFYEVSKWDSEDLNYWYDAEGNTNCDYNTIKETYPQPAARNKPKWLDSVNKTDIQLHQILIEMYAAYDRESLILTAIGLRTSLDRSTEVLGIDPELTFVEKLKALADGGWIGPTEKEILEVVTDAGNAAAHRGWAPSAREISLLLSAFELFLQKAFVVGKDALAVKETIPLRSRKAKTSNI